MKRFHLILLLLAISTSFSVKGQQLKQLKKFNLPEAVKAASVDRSGDLYFTTTSGMIYGYDSEGNSKGIYKDVLSPTLFDPRDGARLFIFDRSNRRYAQLGPTLEINTSTVVDSAFVIDPWLICPGGDFNLWCLDAADGTLKKINTQTWSVETDVKVDNQIVVQQVVLLREYQNFVFMLVKNYGIVIFNSIGKYIRTIKNSNITGFNFLGEELYYKVDNKILFFDLLTAAMREFALPESCDAVLLTDKKMVITSGSVIKLFEYQP